MPNPGLTLSTTQSKSAIIAYKGPFEEYASCCACSYLLASYFLLPCSDDARTSEYLCISSSLKIQHLIAAVRGYKVGVALLVVILMLHDDIMQDFQQSR
ncbi:hypothetical protein I7I48_06759 [Histoplasma ohiense]|nr:hypothetical protein I7I48_06759 [Histoplasma ohiense (nom. inval.)]